RLPILAPRARRRPTRPPAGRRRARELRGSPGTAPPPPAGRSESALGPGAGRGCPPRRPPQPPRAPAAHRGDVAAGAARVRRGSGAAGASPPRARTQLVDPREQLACEDSVRVRAGGGAAPPPRPARG